MSARIHRFRDIGIYSGAGAGIALFGLYGFLPSSFIGGILALNMFGAGATPMSGDGITGRVLVALFMVLSVILTGSISGFTGAVCGRVIGGTLDRIPLLNREKGIDPEIEASPYEKREVPRAVVSTVVKVESEGLDCIADMNDFSEKGARLSFVHDACSPIRNGQLLICTLPGNVVKESRVVWKESSDSACLIGIEFVHQDGGKKNFPYDLPV